MDFNRVVDKNHLRKTTPWFHYSILYKSNTECYFVYNCQFLLAYICCSAVYFLWHLWCGVVILSIDNVMSVLVTWWQIFYWSVKLLTPLYEEKKGGVHAICCDPLSVTIILVNFFWLCFLFSFMIINFNTFVLAKQLHWNFT